MRTEFVYGDTVRVTRNVRDDGTYPGMDPGAPLMRRGSTGYVVDVGTFLQDQIIYSVHFLDQGKIVGCREEELIDITDPWVPSRYEFSREGAMPHQPLRGGANCWCPWAPRAKSSRLCIK